MAKAKTKRRDVNEAGTEEDGVNEFQEMLDDIESSVGENVAVRADNMPLFTYLDMGTFLLDYAMLGGYAEGTGHMIYGNEGSSKTTLCLQAVASAQRKHPTMQAVWVDVEKKFDPLWAAKHGVDLTRCTVIRPPTGEKAVDIIDAATRSKEVTIVVLDSIPSLAPFKVLEKSAEDATVAERARLVGLLCSKLQQNWIDGGRRGHKPTFFCINQFREKIGVMFGDTRTLPGGRFQNFMVDTKLEIKAFEVMSKTEGFELHEHNEHDFRFTKTKGGFSIKKGKFKMVMDDSERTDGLVTGQADDYLTVLTYAKAKGWVTGGGKKWRIKGVNNPDTEDGTFPSRDKAGGMIDYLKTAPDDFRFIKLCLVIDKRRDSRLPDLPPDRYLLGQTVTRGQYAAIREVIDIPEESVAEAE